MRLKNAEKKDNLRVPYALTWDQFASLDAKRQRPKLVEQRLTMAAMMLNVGKGLVKLDSGICSPLKEET